MGRSSLDVGPRRILPRLRDRRVGRFYPLTGSQGRPECVQWYARRPHGFHRGGASAGRGSLDGRNGVVLDTGGHLADPPLILGQAHLALK